MITNLNYKVYKMKKIISPHHPPLTYLPSLTSKVTTADSNFFHNFQNVLCIYQCSISTSFKQMGSYGT